MFDNLPGLLYPFRKKQEPSRKNLLAQALLWALASNTGNTALFATQGTGLAGASGFEPHIRRILS